MEKEISIYTMMEAIRTEVNDRKNTSLQNQEEEFDNQSNEKIPDITNRVGIDVIMEKIRMEALSKNQVISKEPSPPSVETESIHQNSIVENRLKRPKQIDEKRYNPTIERIGINFRARIQRYNFLVCIYDGLAKVIKLILKPI